MRNRNDILSIFAGIFCHGQDRVAVSSFPTNTAVQNQMPVYIAFYHNYYVGILNTSACTMSS